MRRTLLVLAITLSAACKSSQSEVPAAPLEVAAADVLESCGKLGQVIHRAGGLFGGEG